VSSQDVDCPTDVESLARRQRCRDVPLHSVRRYQGLQGQPRQTPIVRGPPRRGWCDLETPPIRPEPFEVPSSVSHHAEAAFVHGTVMPPAEPRELRQRRTPTERPRLQMVRVAAARRAARKLTMPVSRDERAPDRGWYRTGPAPDVQHRPVGAMLHDDGRGRHREDAATFPRKRTSRRRPPR
jgi:hypothetical protein